VVLPKTTKINEKKIHAILAKAAMAERDMTSAPCFVCSSGFLF